MADAKKAKAKEKTAAPPRKGGKRFILLMILFGSLVPFSAPTLLLALGLLPALVALITDSSPQKSTFTTIGFLNLAGVIPFVIELWEKGQTMDAALGIVRRPNTWLIMFGAAAIGQLLLYAVPPAVGLLTVSRLESRLKILREGIEQLKAIWGNDVTTTKPLEIIRRQEEK